MRSTSLDRTSLRQILAALGASRAEGELTIEQDHLVHRIKLRAGRPVAVHVAGRFDPLLRRLHRAGLLDDASLQRALECLAESELRSGRAARRAGVPARALAEALRQQAHDALQVLLSLGGPSVRASFVPRQVGPSEVVTALPLERRPEARRQDKTRARARLRSRRELRRLAFELHPDRNAHLSEPERTRRAERLARLTAAFAR